MKGMSLARRLFMGIVCGCVALTVLGTAAAMADGLPGHATGGARVALPAGAARRPLTLAYSGAHGVSYRRGSLQANRASANCTSSCVGPLFYLGGPVMSTPKVYAIYWKPTGSAQLGTGEPFPAKFEETIDTFMKNVQAAASLPLANAFSVDLLYGDSSVAGRYGWTYGRAISDPLPLPPRNTAECPEATAKEEKEEGEGKPGLPPKGEPCITDAQIRTQLEALIKTEELPTGLGALYFVMTPPKVNSCAGGTGATAECTTNVYCAYHWDIPALATTQPIIYANMPYADRPGCETPDQPNGNPADDEIDTIGHEGNEAITDPLGGEEVVEGETLTGWIDYSGNEVADKCTYPFFEPGIDIFDELDAYGPLLGGTPKYREVNGKIEISSSPGTAYNQEIGTGHYLLQREWSNAAGGCVERAPVPAASFANYPSAPAAGATVAFNGSASTATAGELTSYEWQFGDGSSAQGPALAQVSHAYSKPGTYTVTLKVANDSGASASVSHSVTIVAPSTSPAPEVITKTTVVTTVQTVHAPAEVSARYSAGELASKLGVPAAGATLSGVGVITVGHAQCPPACEVTASLYAKVAVTRHGRHTVRQILIGSVRLRIAAKGTGTIAVTLNATGRRLLSAKHRLHALLKISIEDQQGASWQISRSLVLTAPGKPARHGRKRR